MIVIRAHLYYINITYNCITLHSKNTVMMYKFGNTLE